jgi:hypothetical protein
MVEGYDMIREKVVEYKENISVTDFRNLVNSVKSFGNGLKSELGDLVNLYQNQSALAKAYVNDGFAQAKTAVMDSALVQSISNVATEASYLEMGKAWENVFSTTSKHETNIVNHYRENAKKIGTNIVNPFAAAKDASAAYNWALENGTEEQINEFKTARNKSYVMGAGITLGIIGATATAAVTGGILPAAYALGASYLGLGAARSVGMDATEFVSGYIDHMGNIPMEEDWLFTRNIMTAETFGKVQKGTLQVADFTKDAGFILASSLNAGSLGVAGAGVLAKYGGKLAEKYATEHDNETLFRFANGAQNAGEIALWAGMLTGVALGSVNAGRAIGTGFGAGTLMNDSTYCQGQFSLNIDVDETSAEFSSDPSFTTGYMVIDNGDGVIELNGADEVIQVTSTDGDFKIGGDYSDKNLYFAAGFEGAPETLLEKFLGKEHIITKYAESNYNGAQNNNANNGSEVLGVQDINEAAAVVAGRAQDNIKAQRIESKYAGKNLQSNVTPVSTLNSNPSTFDTMFGNTGFNFGGIFGTPMRDDQYQNFSADGVEYNTGNQFEEGQTFLMSKNNVTISDYETKTIRTALLFDLPGTSDNYYGELFKVITSPDNQMAGSLDPVTDFTGQTYDNGTEVPNDGSMTLGFAVFSDDADVIGIDGGKISQLGYIGNAANIPTDWLASVPWASGAGDDAVAVGVGDLANGVMPGGIQLDVYLPKNDSGTVLIEDYYVKFLVFGSDQVPHELDVQQAIWEPIYDAQQDTNDNSINDFNFVARNGHMVYPTAVLEGDSNFSAFHLVHENEGISAANLTSAITNADAPENDQIESFASVAHLNRRESAQGFKFDGFKLRYNPTTLACGIEVSPTSDLTDSEIISTDNVGAFRVLSQTQESFIHEYGFTDWTSPFSIGTGLQELFIEDPLAKWVNTRINFGAAFDHIGANVERNEDWIPYTLAEMLGFNDPKIRKIGQEGALLEHAVVCEGNWNPGSTEKHNQTDPGGPDPFTPEQSDAGTPDIYDPNNP